MSVLTSSFVRWLPSVSNKFGEKVVVGFAVLCLSFVAPNRRRHRRVCALPSGEQHHRHDIRPDQRDVISGMLNLSRNFGLITAASVMGAVFRARVCDD